MTSLAINGINLNVEEIGKYDKSVPLKVAAAAMKEDGLDELIFEVDGERYLAYGDGLNFEGMKKGNIPASVFKGNVPLMVESEINGEKKDIRILVIDNEINTSKEGAKKTLGVVGIGTAIPTAVKVSLAPSAAKAAAEGTNFVAKIAKFSGNIVSTLGTKLGIGNIGVGVAAGVAIAGAGAAGGAIYFGSIKDQDYSVVRSLIKD